MATMNVEELKEASKSNSLAQGTFVVSKCEMKAFRHKPGFFMQCELRDRTGSVKAVVWDNAESYKEWLTNQTVVEISCEATRYNDQPQIVIKKMTRANTYDPSDLVLDIKGGLEKRKELIRELESISKTIKNPVCKKIWECVCRPDFFECPGGVGNVHHNYLGGLMEHSLGMIHAAEGIFQNAGLDRDILLTGCLIHDIGKIKSYDWKISIEMNDRGRLLHHTYLGFLMLQQIAEEAGIQKEDGDLLKLLHIIVSHHGDQGHRKPMFPEAVAVSAIDAMDAFVNHTTEFISQEENQEMGTNWTKFCHLTQRQYFIPRDQKEEIPATGESIEEKGIKTDSIF